MYPVYWNYIFCFLLIPPKAVLYASQIIKLFSHWSILQGERLKMTLVYVPIPSAGRRSLSVTNYKNLSDFFSRNTEMNYGNIVVVEMVIFRWLPVSSSQVNFFNSCKEIHNGTFSLAWIPRGDFQLSCEQVLEILHIQDLFSWKALSGRFRSHMNRTLSLWLCAVEHSAPRKSYLPLMSRAIIPIYEENCTSDSF